jgi:putative transposase
MTLPAARQEVFQLVTRAIEQGAGQAKACGVVGLTARTFQRWRKDSGGVDRRTTRVQKPASKLTELERRRMMAIASSPEFGHLSPSQIVPRLADKGIYIASEASFYRVLRDAGLTRHRHAVRPKQERRKPRALSATAPNQLYSWDITYLPTRTVGNHFYLYLFLDLFSRKVVGWQVYDDESSDLAAELMRDICRREAIQPAQVVLHSDNGSPMKGASMLATLQSLGVVPSFSRPAVSNDNPYSVAAALSWAIIASIRLLSIPPTFMGSPVYRLRAPGTPYGAMSGLQVTSRGKRKPLGRAGGESAPYSPV